MDAGLEKAFEFQDKMYIKESLIIQFKNIAAIAIAAMFFSCNERLSTVRKWEVQEIKPQTSGQGIKLVYTDSGKIKAFLRTPLMQDFTQLDFGYRAFPEGLELDFYDEKNQKNTIKADYGILYEQTNLVDLQNNVVITTSDSVVLKANQLYWDQSKQWVFSDVPYQVQFKNGAVNNGESFDANEKFNKFISRSNKGMQVIDQ